VEGHLSNEALCSVEVRETCVLELVSPRMQASPQKLQTIFAIPTSGSTTMSRWATVRTVSWVLSDWLSFQHRAPRKKERNRKKEETSERDKERKKERGIVFGFWFLGCYAATQIALQLHQERIQVVRSNREAWKRPARGHFCNGPWTWRYTHTHVGKQKRNRTKLSSINTEHGWITHTWNSN